MKMKKKAKKTPAPWRSQRNLNRAVATTATISHATTSRMKRHNRCSFSSVAPQVQKQLPNDISLSPCHHHDHKQGARLAVEIRQASNQHPVRRVATAMVRAA